MPTYLLHVGWYAGWPDSTHRVLPKQFLSFMLYSMSSIIQRMSNILYKLDGMYLNYVFKIRSFSKLSIRLSARREN